jgi:hypothetical protein
MSEGDRSLLCAVILAMLLSLIPALARAQHNHDLGHADYHDWASERTSNCCNNQDCGSLADDEWRETARGTEVLIRGKWCPVKKGTLHLERSLTQLGTCSRLHPEQ